MPRDRLRVLLPVRWPTGGIRTYMRYVYSRFDPADHEFTLVGPREGLEQIANDLPMHRLRMVKVDPETNQRFFVTVGQVIWGGSFDLVHSHGLTAGIASLPAARLGGVPHILTGHDIFLDSQFAGAKGRAKRWMIGTALRSFTVVHCIGEDARSNWCSYFPALTGMPSRLVTIQSGIETASFLVAPPENIRKEVGIGPGVRLFGFLGRFMAQKGFPELIRAVAVLRDRGYGPERFRVACFGWGGFIREEQQVIRGRGLEEYFHFLAFRTDVASTLKGLDVVVMPSRWEGLSLLAMECLVAGVPLIGTTCSGLKEVLQGSPATLVRPGDIDALADAMIDRIGSCQRTQAAEFAHEAAKRFSVDRTATELAALYHQVARNAQS